MLGAGDILRIYRQKDVVEKAFMHSKPNVKPLYARTETGTRARMFLSVLRILNNGNDRFQMRIILCRD